MNSKIGFVSYQDDATLSEHIKRFHETSTLEGYVREVVYGGVDGVVTTLAVISGFVGASQAGIELSTLVVLLFGLANLLADATSMGLGNFLGVRSEKAAFNRHRERQENEYEDKDRAIEATKYLMQKKGYSYEDAQALAPIIYNCKEHWLEFTLTEELGVHNEDTNTVISSLFTFGSFIAFGMLPIFPFLINNLNYQYIWALGAALLSLTVLGLLRQYITKEPWFKAVGETVLVGGVSAIIAYGVGSLFK